MLALLQRVASARVEVAGEVVGAIDQGLLVLVCAEPADTLAVAERMVDKILKLRIFGDTVGRMNLGVRDVGGGLLIVSQFTLAADTSAGNRPGFAAAAPPQRAQALYQQLLQCAHERHAHVAAGRFGADMQVHLVNDGPVTIPLTVR
jgi:D-tyrosyl-tRNA(Tyr) deacylase